MVRHPAPSHHFMLFIQAPKINIHYLNTANNRVNIPEFLSYANIS
jgi:hypothetical protein